MTGNWINPEWSAPPGIRAASTLCTGGVSTGVYASWNLGTHVGDDPAHVIANRLLLKQQLALPSEPIWLNQVHGCQVIKASALASGAMADASYSREVGVVCAVMTADCLPLLLCSEDGLSVAVVHCGWRGLLAGIIEQVLINIGSGSLLAWMGPAIGPQAFVVGSEVRQLFIDKNPDHVQAFFKQSDGQWLADLYKIARTDLGTVGINQIYGGDRCTYSDSDRFFSHRRQGVTGRMATLIWREIKQR